MDSWLQKARSMAEEAAKKSQELTKEAAKLSQGIASETAKRSKEFAVEATKRADLIKAEAFKLPDQIKTLADGITPQIPSLSPAPCPPTDLEKYGVTDELREFVRGLTISTFRDFPLEDEPKTSDVPTFSNVRQDLTEWQARHATLVLSTVKEISHFRYGLCPRHMKERRFWRIYFTLVNSHVAPYEKAFMDEAQLRSTEQDKDVRPQENQPVATPSKLKISESSSQCKVSTENDLDAFLLGDLGSGDEEPDGGGGGFDDDDDDDLDSIVNASSSKRDGGGGISWHHSGSGLHKLNSIQDFVACARFLIGEGYVDKDKLGAIGFSAGGLLLGAAINMFPDLFCAAILKVGKKDSRWTVMLKEQ